MTDASKINALRESIKKIAGTFDLDIVNITVCTVESVSDFTCDCKPISGNATTNIPGVKLNAEANDGFLIVPKVDSTVLVASSTKNNYYVLMYSDIDKVICVIDEDNSFEFSSSGFIWNGGNLGGLTKVIKLTEKLNNLENKVNDFISTYLAHTHSVPGVTSGPSATTSLVPSGAPITPLTPTQQSEIEDTKIKH